LCWMGSYLTGRKQRVKLKDYLSESIQCDDHRECWILFSVFQEIFVTRILIKLYTSFVRPILEHAASVWSPHKSVHSERLERVQHNFIRYAVRRLPWRLWPLPTYDARCLLIGLEVLFLRGTFWLAGSIVRTLLSCYDLRRSLTQGGVTRGY
jgi:hypothetical protein